MENFIVCINAVTPVFLIMLLGYISRKKGIIDENTVTVMNKVSFRLFLPMMLFKNIYKSDLTTAFNPRLIIYSIVVAVFTALISTVYVIRTVKDDSKRGVMIQGIFRSNYATIGLPLVASLCPGQDVSSIAILIALVVATYNVLSVIVLQYYSGGKTSFREVAIKILKNPLIIASAAGMLFLVFEIKLPSFLETTVNNIGGIGSPLMVFLLGAFFEFSGLRKNSTYIIKACIGKLIAMPMIILPIGILCGFRNIELAGLLGMSATSSAVSSFTMAQQMNGDAELAGELIVCTSFLCPFTIFIWSYLLKVMGLL